VGEKKKKKVQYKIKLFQKEKFPRQKVIPTAFLTNCEGGGPIVLT
jgi:hypothetical protein